MSLTDADLDALEALHNAVKANDAGEPWVALYADDRHEWGVGPSYEMGHRATLDGWCEHEARLIVMARNALPHLVAEVRRLRKALNEAQLRSIEASNPGIDMDEVRRLRGCWCRTPTSEHDPDCPGGAA